MGSHLQRRKQSNEIPILPVELIIEILSRLPVKSLLKFKCVSTQWRCLISSRNFIKTHLNVFTNNKDFIHNRLLLRFIQPHHHLMDCSISSLLYDSDPKTFQLDYPMQNPRKSVTILGSVNGLICLSIDKDLILWNPSIRKFKKFRDPQSGRYFLHGFGYDQLHDDYNLVLISKEVRIYSSNSDSWRIIVNDRSHGLVRETDGIFVNGKLHWAKSPSQDQHSYNGWDITSIDVTDGKWGKVEKPFYGEGDFDLTPCVGVLGSDLSNLCNNQSLQTDVWIMKEYEIKESWTKMYTINRPNDHPEGYGFSPLFCKMSNKGEILIQVDQSTFMIYDPKKESFICQKVIIDEYPFWEASIYINESLVWPISQKGMMQCGVLRSLRKQTRFEQQMQQPRRWEIPK
ncbi:F-box/kelch-repeat protein At3g23880-like [Solanum verrucosum]|uniref:F-box/kelch-repeat protein At3g23880-like n=1 Tax=Solanum verrucosum TaxID=315347 RepID=UPI0020D189BE|nr:F-box/kelch-repeat protein At3g23880-like [Solanum verrucosum]